MNEFEFRSKPVLDLLNKSPLFDSQAFYKCAIDEVEDGAFVRGCLAINIDPDIVRKQADEILKLQRALDQTLNTILKLDAPSFKKYAELEKENKELKETLKLIAQTVEPYTDL